MSTNPLGFAWWPLSAGAFGRRVAGLLVLCALAVGCSDRLTPSRAGTIIRHSKAFLSGSPESQPVLDRVSSLLTGSKGLTPARQEGDSCVAVIVYHWPERAVVGGSGRPGPDLTAMIVLSRSGNGWAVDDERSRALTPSWPQLPRTPNPFLQARPAP